VGDVAAISRRASPGGALRMLRFADDAAELKVLARFIERTRRGAFALHVTGEAGARVVKQTARQGAEAMAHADVLLVKAARKGGRGAEFLGTRAGRVLLKPHPLIGLAKGVWKGNAQKLAQRLVDALGPGGWWMLPLLGAWVLVEVVWIGRRLVGAR
jgi:hypothetical protein